jgi:pyrroline-5-carboxylate reductase
VSELAEREVEQTSATLQDCLVHWVIPAVSSNVVVGYEHIALGDACSAKQRQFVAQEKLLGYGCFPQGGRMLFPDPCAN